MSEIVSHEVTGYVLDPYNEKMWAQCIIDIIKNQGQAIVIGQNGYQRLITRYNQKSMYEKIMNMYSETLKMN